MHQFIKTTLQQELILAILSLIYVLMQMRLKRNDLKTRPLVEITCIVFQRTINFVQKCRHASCTQMSPLISGSICINSLSPETPNVEIS
jgi:hypothetical protein